MVGKGVPHVRPVFGCMCFWFVLLFFFFFLPLFPAFLAVGRLAPFLKSRFKIVPILSIDLDGAPSPLMNFWYHQMMHTRTHPHPSKYTTPSAARHAAHRFFVPTHLSTHTPKHTHTHTPQRPLRRPPLHALPASRAGAPERLPGQGGAHDRLRAADGAEGKGGKRLCVCVCVCIYLCVVMGCVCVCASVCVSVCV